MGKLKKSRRNFQKFKTSDAHRYPIKKKRKAVQALESGVKRKDLLKAIGVKTDTPSKCKKEFRSFSKVEVSPTIPVLFIFL